MIFADIHIRLIKFQGGVVTVKLHILKLDIVIFMEE